MADRREEKERLRRERIAAQQRAASSESRREKLALAGAGLIVAAIVVGLVLVITGSGGDGEGADAGDFDANAFVEPQSGSVNGVPLDGREGTPPPPVEQAVLETAAKDAGCELSLDLPDEGSAHIPENADTPDYDTNPPTSGDHAEPQADGAYAEKPDDKHTLHAVEHSRVAFQYSPELDEDEQLAVKGVFDADPFGMLLYPNPDMPFAVAATAWQQMIGCESYEGAATLDALRAFRDVYRGQGPEDFPIVLSG